MTKTDMTYHEDDARQHGVVFDNPHCFSLMLISGEYEAKPRLVLDMPNGDVITHPLDHPDYYPQPMGDPFKPYTATVEMSMQVTGDPDMPDEIKKWLLKNMVAMTRSTRVELINRALAHVHTATMGRMIVDAEEHGIDGRLERVRAGDEAPEA